MCKRFFSFDFLDMLENQNISIWYAYIYMYIYTHMWYSKSHSITEIIPDSCTVYHAVLLINVHYFSNVQDCVVYFFITMTKKVLRTDN